MNRLILNLLIGTFLLCAINSFGQESEDHRLSITKTQNKYVLSIDEMSNEVDITIFFSDGSKNVFHHIGKKFHLPELQSGHHTIVVKDSDGNLSYLTFNNL